MYFGILLFVYISYQLYQRYVPVLGVEKLTEKVCKDELEDVEYVDVRDYQEAYKVPIIGAKNLPFGYLKRHVKEIEKKDIVIIASDSLLKNVSIRLLRRYGFRIKGYCIVQEYIHSPHSKYQAG